jgi:hypothetical protein
MEGAFDRREVRAMVKRVILTSIAILILMAISVVASRHPIETVSLLAGTSVAIASFLVLVFTVLWTMADDGGGTKPFVIVIGFVKLGLLGAVLWWLVSRDLVHPITFLAGFSTVVLALLVEGLRGKRKVRTR